MKVFTKFKQLKREIKLVIITVLIASCIGVYATGECIISATADDVSYNNTTVQAAIDDLFSMSENYCPPGYDCFLPAIIGTTSSTDTTAFRSDTYRDKIRVINLDDTINPPNNYIESWDIGEHQNGDVMAYITQNLSDNELYDLYIQGNGSLYANPDSSYLFAGLIKVYEINGIEKLNTTKVTDMSYMFYRLGTNSYIPKLDLGDNFDTSNVTNMEYMFYSVGYTTSSFTMDVGDKFDTSKVTNMRYMFSTIGFGASNLDLSFVEDWDVSNVTDMQNMFSSAGYYVNTLKIGNLSSWDTSNVTNMADMFNGAGGYDSSTYSIGTLNIHATNIQRIFYRFKGSGTINIYNNIGNNTNYNQAFANSGPFTVNYSRNVTAIDSIIATGGSNITKGVLLD